jgi:hypothetical protein
MKLLYRRLNFMQFRDILVDAALAFTALVYGQAGNMGCFYLGELRLWQQLAVI